MKLKVQRRRKQNGAHQFAFRCHKAYLRQEMAKRAILTHYFLFLTCTNDKGFAKVARVGFALEDFSAAKHHMLTLKIVFERRILIGNIDLNFQNVSNML